MIVLKPSFILPEISHVMRLPRKANGAGTEHVHPTRSSYDALGCFKSRVSLSQNEYGLVLVVLGVSGDGLIALNQVCTDKVHRVRNPQARGYQEDADGERTRV